MSFILLSTYTNHLNKLQIIFHSFNFVHFCIKKVWFLRCGNLDKKTADTISYIFLGPLIEGIRKYPNAFELSEMRQTAVYQGKKI